MPARNVLHDVVVRALIADGWTITDDPLTVGYGGRNLFVDLGAEPATLAANKGDQKIAVEIQSFLSKSVMFDLERAVGQFVVYRILLQVTHPARLLFLAVSKLTYDDLAVDPVWQLVAKELQMKLLIFDDEEELVTQWKN